MLKSVSTNTKAFFIEENLFIPILNAKVKKKNFMKDFEIAKRIQVSIEI